MSTRSNIIYRCDQKIGNPDNPNNGWVNQQYYRHCDGYLAGLGMDLIQILLKLNNESMTDYDGRPKNPTLYAQDIKSFLDSNFNLGYEKEDCYRGDIKLDMLHGDIEYLYLITAANNKITLQYTQIKPFGDQAKINLLDLKTLLILKFNINGQYLETKKINYIAE